MFLGTTGDAAADGVVDSDAISGSDDTTVGATFGIFIAVHVELIRFSSVSLLSLPDRI